MNEVLSSERYLRRMQQLEQAPLEIQKLLEQERAARLAAEAKAKRSALLGQIVGFVAGVASGVAVQLIIEAIAGR